MSKHNKVINKIKYKIINGEFKVGSKLPSLRAVAKCLSVSKSTVLLAFQILEDEGYIRPKLKSGYYVTGEFHDITGNNDKKTKHDSLSFSDSFRNVSLSEVENYHDLYPLKEVNKTLKYSIKNLTTELISNLKKDSNQELKRFISNEYLDRDLILSSKDIILTSGRIEAIHSILYGLPKNKILANTKLPKEYIKIIEHLGFSIDYLPITDGKIDTTILQGMLDSNEYPMLLFLNNFHYGNDCSFCNTSRKSLVDISSKYGLLIVEDEYDSVLFFGKKLLKSLKCFDSNVILIGDSSNIIGSAYKFGWIVNKNNINEQKKIRDYFNDGACPIITNCISYYIRNGLYKINLSQMRKELELRKSDYTALLYECLPKGIEIHSTGGGSKLWIEIKNTFDYQRLRSSLAGKSIEISYDEKNKHDENSKLIIINYSYPLSKNIIDAIKKLGEEIVKSQTKTS